MKTKNVKMSCNELEVFSQILNKKIKVNVVPKKPLSELVMNVGMSNGDYGS